MHFLDSFSADSVQFGWRDPLGSRRTYYRPIGALYFADGLRAGQSEAIYFNHSDQLDLMPLLNGFYSEAA